MFCPIVCQGRSGTTFLFELLCSHSKIRGVREMFGADKEIYKPFPRGPQLDQEMLRRITGEKQQGVYFTTTYFHGHKVNCIDAFFRKEKAKIIVLKRNQIDVALSLALVQQAMGAGRYDHDGCFRRPYENQRVSLDKVGLLKAFEQNEKNIQAIDLRFYGLAFHYVRYEDLVKNRTEMCNAILSFLGLELEELKLGWIERPNPLVKQRKLPREQAIINYAELFDYFKGTKYENHFLEENA